MATAVTFIPLTTTFSAPVACSSQFVIPGIATNRFMYAFDPGQKIKDPTALDCFPEPVISWWGQDAATTSTGLGGTTMVCPNLYTTAAIINQSTRTLIACCPSAYEYVELMSAPYPGQCKSTLKPGTLTFIGTGSNGLYSSSTSLLATSSPIFGVQVNGYITPGATSSTSSASSTATVSSTTSTSASSTVSTTPTPTNDASGLPTGAKAGIGAGTGALALLAILGAFLWYRRKHRYKAVELPVEGETTPPAGGYYQSEGKGQGAQELGGTRTDGVTEYYQPTKPSAPQELSARPRPSELA